MSIPTFPTIYVKELGFIENGKTLEAKEIVSITPTYQVKAITNTSQSDAKGILAIVSDVFKQMMFECISGISIESVENGVCTSIIRFRRTIDRNDKLI